MNHQGVLAAVEPEEQETRRWSPVLRLHRRHISPVPFAPSVLSSQPITGKATWNIDHCSAIRAVMAHALSQSNETVQPCDQVRDACLSRWNEGPLAATTRHLMRRLSCGTWLAFSLLLLGGNVLLTLEGSEAVRHGR